MSSLLASYGPESFMMPRINPGSFPQRHGTIRFQNGRSVNFDFTLEELRPREVGKSDDDDMVLVVREQGVTELHATWMATIRGRDAVYEGELAIPVSDRVYDLSRWLNAQLNGEDD